MDVLGIVDRATGAIETRVEALDEIQTKSVNSKVKTVQQENEVIGGLVDDLVEERRKLQAQVKVIEGELARRLRDEKELEAQAKSIQADLARHIEASASKAKVQDKLINKNLSDNKEGKANLEKSNEALEKLKGEVPPPPSPMTPAMTRTCTCHDTHTLCMHG